jgi:DNA-3-methyladenine glycosylase I
MVTAEEYVPVFRALESNLLKKLATYEIADHQKAFREIDRFKAMSVQKFEDADYYRKLVHIVFFSGFKAEIVEKKIPVIDAHFPDCRIVAAYGDKELEAIAADPAMIRNKPKIKACRDNAKTFAEIVAQHAAFSNYIESFDPKATLENVVRLRQDIISRFAFLSSVTSLHFLMDIGMPVVKPDSSLMRIFSRLGILEGDKPIERNIHKLISVAQTIAHDTGQPIKYVDMVFSSHGMMTATGTELRQGICLKDRPKCGECPVTKYCDYYTQHHSA